MVLEGGMRDRMILYSLYLYIREGLDLLGWFDTNPTLDRRPLNMPWGGFPDGDPIPLSAVVVAPEDTDFFPLEVGSNAQFGNRVFTVSIYGEDDAVGYHLRGDISAMLRGRLTIIAGYDTGKLDVYDHNQATPPIVATMDIVDIIEGKALGARKEWERHWHEISFKLEDEDWT